MPDTKWDEPTPPPWTAAWNEDGSWVGVDCGNANDPHCAEVCEINTENILADDPKDVLKRAIADARLIAAAPDLLAALELIVTWQKRSNIMTRCGEAVGEIITRCDAAIAKAKGR